MFVILGMPVVRFGRPVEGPHAAIDFVKFRPTVHGRGGVGKSCCLVVRACTEFVGRNLSDPMYLTFRCPPPPCNNLARKIPRLSRLRPSS